MKEKRNPGKMQFILQHEYQLVSEKKGEKISKNKKSGSCFSFTLNTLTSLKMLSHIVDFFLMLSSFLFANQPGNNLHPQTTAPCQHLSLFF